MTACKNSYGNDDATIDVNPDTGAFEVRLKMVAVDDVYEPGREIVLEKAREIDPTVGVGDDGLCDAEYQEVWAASRPRRRAISSARASAMGNAAR